MSVPVHDRIAKSYQTVREMMSDREYLTEDQLAYLHSKDYNELMNLSKSADIFSIDIPDAVRILYHRRKKFKINDVHNQVTDAFPLVILIFVEPLSTANMKSLAQLREKVPSATIQVFQVSELMFNITRHSLVPKHEVLKDEDIKDVMERYSLKSIHQLPLIMKTDPVARYLGLRIGQVVRVTRPSQTAGEYVLYRCCV
jgi:DNA-directed RNA polymerase subunit H (RpoH/RPB5)